jgi:hypothetical protein
MQYVVMVGMKMFKLHSADLFCQLHGNWKNATKEIAHRRLSPQRESRVRQKTNFKDRR